MRIPGRGGTSTAARRHGATAWSVAATGPRAVAVLVRHGVSPALTACVLAACVADGAESTTADTECSQSNRLFTSTVTCTVVIDKVTGDGGYEYRRLDGEFARSSAAGWPLSAEVSVGSGTVRVLWRDPDGHQHETRASPGAPGRLSGDVDHLSSADHQIAFVISLRPTTADPDGIRRARDIRMTLTYASGS